jgi:hypothetical protein
MVRETRNAVKLRKKRSKVKGKRLEMLHSLFCTTLVLVDTSQRSFETSPLILHCLHSLSQIVDKGWCWDLELNIHCAISPTPILGSVSMSMKPTSDCAMAAPPSVKSEG